MNIKYIRDSSNTFNYFYNRYYDSDVAYEAFQYYLPSSKGNKRYLPSSFIISYTGGFPVHTDTSKYGYGGDWKGNIAFNQGTVRLSEQTYWYPILYNSTTGEKQSSLTFDIDVSCEDCTSIFLNGCGPQAGPLLSAKTDFAVPLLLFAGDVTLDQSEDISLINSSLDDHAVSTLNAQTFKIKEFFSDFYLLEIPYRLTLIEAPAVSKNRNWYFTSTPTVVYCHTYKNNLNYKFDSTGLLLDTSLLSFISHELGHFIIGTKFVPQGELRWFLLEGLCEYVSYLCIRELYGDSTSYRLLSEYFHQMHRVDTIQSGALSNMNELYRYNYAPIILIGLENIIGYERMKEWIRTLVRDNQHDWTLQYFKKSLLTSGVSNEEYERFKHEILEEQSVDKLEEIIVTN